MVEVDDAARRRYPYKPPFPLTVIVNPVIEPLSDETLLINEGCLSIPGLRGDVLSARAGIRVHYVDRDGEAGEVVAEGLTAGTFQHELDHLDGVLFLDRADPRSLQHLGGVRTPPPGGLPGTDPALHVNFWCPYAWLGGAAPSADVLIETEGELITAVSASTPPPSDAERLDGLVIPGLANAHSHAFQRALRGRTHAATGSFWTWRKQMYELAGALDPQSMFALTRACFAEMALAGVTLVGEFHYLHHGPGGVRMQTPTRWARWWSRPPPRPECD